MPRSSPVKTDVRLRSYPFLSLLISSPVLASSDEARLKQPSPPSKVPTDNRRLPRSLLHPRSCLTLLASPLRPCLPLTRVSPSPLTLRPLLESAPTRKLVPRRVLLPRSPRSWRHLRPPLREWISPLIPVHERTLLPTPRRRPIRLVVRPSLLLWPPLDLYPLRPLPRRALRAFTPPRSLRRLVRVVLRLPPSLR